jgi:hypothetical protein
MKVFSRRWMTLWKRKVLLKKDLCHLKPSDHSPLLMLAGVLFGKHQGGLCLKAVAVIGPLLEFLDASLGGNKGIHEMVSFLTKVTSHIIRAE